MRLQTALMNTALGSLILGAAFYTLVLLFGGLESLEQYLYGLLQPTALLWMKFVFGAYVISLGLQVGLYLTNHNQIRNENFVYVCIKIPNIVGAAFIPTLQTMSGVFMALVISWVLLEPETALNPAHINLIFLSLKFLLVAFCYEVIDSIFKEKFKKRTYSSFRT